MNLPHLYPDVAFRTGVMVRAILSALLMFTLGACDDGNPHNNVIADMDSDGVSDDKDVCPNGTRSNGALGEGCADGCIAGLVPDANNAVCVDLDECTLGTDDCNAFATCKNNFGGFSCDCPKGYDGDGKTCADVNECATSADDCADVATCTNTPGSFTCICPSDHVGDGRICTFDAGCSALGCGANSHCDTTNNNVKCVCNDGYAGDGHTCTDVNECAENQTGYTACRIATGGTCENKAASYECTACPSGYELSLDLLTCNDINECLSGGLGITACDIANGGVCENNTGGYVCTKCPTSSSLSSDQKSCQPPNVGPLFTLTTSDTSPNGAWSWFEDERAIIDASDPANPRLLVSSVSSAASDTEESGDIDILWRNLSTGSQGEFELHNRLENDDHDSAAIYLRPDGHYLAMYSKHGSDNMTHWRVSTSPHDPTSWEAMQTLDNSAGTTYNNIYYLPNDNEGAGRLYNFTRSLNYDPTVQVSSDSGSNWSSAGKLLTQGGSSNRPYVKYASDGEKIHFITTNEHPRDFSNSVYHGYIQNGVLYNSNGKSIDANIFDATGVAPTLLTPVFSNGSSFNGTTMNRAWTISLEIDNTGNPVAILTARANDSSSDHRFLYARFDGIKWQIHEMANAGGFLYTAEDDYTGLASIDPENPNVVYMSSKIDPRSQTSTNKYELYRGITTDFGASWSWSALTVNSTVDNLRPIVPSWNGQNTVVLWLSGTYTSYTNWDTEVVGVQLTDAGRKALLWQGTSASPNAWDQASNNWDSGKGSIDTYHQGDEVTFDDSADTLNIELQGSITPMGVAFNNNAKLYKLTGAGIGGSGRLRVIGGGTVTLANSANSYTGETLVSRGELILEDQATISGSSSIYVASQGTLDVTDLTSGTLTLSGKTLTVDGKVNGNVTLSNSTFSGKGQVSGNLVANAGAVISVGDNGFSVVPSLENAVYIDASSGESGNTRLSDGSVFTPPLNGTTGLDNNWEQRMPFASGGNIYEASGERAEDAPQLKTTISSLIPGHNYHVYVMFWDASMSNDAQDWNIRTGFAPNSLGFFANGTTSDASDLGALGAVQANTLTYSVQPTIFTESNRVLLAANIGPATANASGQIDVFVDDMPSTIGANNRTWYDGVAVRKVTVEPQVIALTTGGDYNQAADATLRLDIHSPQALDRVVVSGNFSAAGTLVVSLVAGAPAPQLGDSFEIIQAGTFSGEFNNYDLPALDPGLAWDTSSLNTSGVLTVISEP